MQDYQKAFIKFCLANKVLLFGEFTLKSGRVSPYFFNAGLFDTGESLAKLGFYYAQAIKAWDLDYDVIFGPAYKGIQIATTTAIALADKFSINKPFCYNRKEIKDHGEGGNIVGSPLKGNVLLVDDVISAGVAVRESLVIIKAEGATLTGIMIAMDRQERGQGERSAIQEIEEDFNVQVRAVIKLSDLIEYIEMHLGDDVCTEAHLASMKKYQVEYGVR